jgi:hypothetical protein
LHLVTSGMIIRLVFISVIILTSYLVNGQVVVVNPDGTHTIAFLPESESAVGVVVNPDGTHTVVQRHGSIAIAIGGTGMHRAANTNSFDRQTTFWRPNKKYPVVRTTVPHSLIIDPLGNYTVAVMHATFAMLLIPSFIL